VTPAARYVVLGSNSFSGATFVDHLLQRGESVVGISRSPEPDPAFLPYRWRPAAGDFRFFAFDLNHDLDEIDALIRRERPAYVVNFAAQSMVAESWDQPEHWFTTNVVSTVRLHERLRRLDGLEKYVHVTTPEVYGSTTGRIREGAAFNPSTPYAVSRAASDMSLQTYFKAYGFPVVFTRAANVFGPGQQLYRIVPRTVLFLKLGRTLQLHGGGASERSFIHAADVADATRRVAENGRPGETYHVSTDRQISIRKLVEMICERLGTSFDEHVEVVGERLGKDAAYQLDSRKIRNELGWSDEVTLESGIDETVAWVERFRDELALQPSEYRHKP